MAAALREVLLLRWGGASLMDAGANSIRTALPAHSALTFFHFLLPPRLRRRLPALSRERPRLPCDTVAPTARRARAALAWLALGIPSMTWPLTLADSVWTAGAAAC